MLIILNILINLAIIFFMYHYLKWNLGKNKGSSDLGNFEEETEKLIIEINRTTERNLQLIESKIRQIKSVIDDAERVVSVINREKSGSRQEEAVLKKLENRSFFENVEKIRKENDFTELTEPVIKINLSRNNTTEKKEKASAADEETLESGDIRDRAITMYRNGINIELISRNLNIPTGEIELMISLDKAGRE